MVNRTRQQKKRLRKEFVRQAKKYLGVPYAKKYHEEDSELYKSKLFLDCCGLVRRIMYDLRYEFGFRIGGGNQAYMFDTLPKIIEDVNEIKPGDLVFTKAQHNTGEKKKKQLHDILHVEIMLGKGEKCIGARWHHKVVTVFDSYKFTSKTYSNNIYIFKSIDTWLLGICQSFCPLHHWPYCRRIYPKKTTELICLHKRKKRRKSEDIVKNLRDLSLTSIIINKKKFNRRTTTNNSVSMVTLPCNNSNTKDEGHNSSDFQLPNL
ncbi:hypothetical protein SNEBB_003124 [Seison nebaliae]|nr:hypothetical protein SNEBB_003124 [Seison nebaliae]